LLRLTVLVSGLLLLLLLLLLRSKLLLLLLLLRSKLLLFQLLGSICFRLPRTDDEAAGGCERMVVSSRFSSLT
jgi:hypothetical protein